MRNRVAKRLLFLIGVIRVFKKIKWFFSNVDKEEIEILLNEKY